MRRLKTALGSLLLCGGTALLPSTSVADPAIPAVQALLAAQDTELVNRVVDWNERNFELAEEMTLDQSLRDSAAQLVRVQAGRLRTLITAWLSEERAAAKGSDLESADLAQALYRRSINEMAIWSVESVGPAHDEAWLKAVLAPTACSSLYPMYFARRIAMIQAAPMDVRPDLMAAEKELLSRWGTPRQGLPARPAAVELIAADSAITRLREGLPVTAAPMAPFLARRVFAQDRKPGKPDRWERCAKAQWWLQSQLADTKTGRTQALTNYRYSTMLDANDFVPAGFKPKSEPTLRAEGKPVYPHAASYFQVEGSTTLKVSTDEQGSALSAEVIAREIRVPGVRDNRPLAFEALLDDAALEFARQRSYPVGKIGKVQFVMVWKLGEDGDATR